MADYYLNKIYNPQTYRGYKNSSYFQTVFIPNFTLINDNNLILTKEELRTLESKICTGKSTSLLADALFHRVNILSPITKNNLLNDKFVIRILDIMTLYKSKNPDEIYNFEWVYNLKKVGFKFTDSMQESLNKIGFINNIDLNKNMNLVEMELMTKLLVCPADFLQNIEQLLKENPTFIPQYEHITIFYNNVVNNYFKMNNFTIVYEDLIKLYELVIKNKYQVTKKDLESFAKLFSQHMLNIYIDRSYSDVTNKSLKPFIENIMNIFYKYDIYLDEDIMKLLLSASFKKLLNENKSGYSFCDKYRYYINCMTDFITVLLKNPKNQIPKYNYLDLISFNTSTIYCDGLLRNMMFAQYKGLIKLLLDNNLLNINNDTTIQLLLNRDHIMLEYLMEEGKIIPDNQMMNLSCYTGNYELIKTLINYKMIPTCENVYYIPNINANNTSILNLLLDYGCLMLSDELMEYLISCNIKINDRDKYGWDNDEAIEKIINYSIKYRVFPYTDIETEYKNIFKNITLTTSIMELENILDKFDNDIKMQSLMDHLVTQNNMNLIYYLKSQTNIKPSLKIIYKNTLAELYLRLFDLKSN